MRRRPLSGDERRLWAEVLRSVRPLAGRARPIPPEARPDAEPASRAEPSRPVPTVPTPSRPALPPIVPLERGTARALARGRSGPDATLDLHGLTQAEAHARLHGFLRRGQAAGHGLVLVITGRGKAGGDGIDGRGVLRRTVPLWLGLPELRSVVLAFAEAGPRQGGAGAIYVRLRRRRDPGVARP